MPKIRRIVALHAVALGVLFAAPTGARAQDCPDDVGGFVAGQCPCNVKNHGTYVSCVVRHRNELRRDGCLIDRKTNGEIARCAARSTCGKEGRVVCCFVVSEGECSDTNPADNVATGTCSNVDRPCNVAGDCTEFRGRVARDEPSCTAAGGQSAGEGSVCTACDALLPTD